MPFLLIPFGTYLYGRFVDGDGGFPWTRIAISLAAIALIIFMVRSK